MTKSTTKTRKLLEKEVISRSKIKEQLTLSQHPTRSWIKEVACRLTSDKAHSVRQTPLQTIVIKLAFHQLRLEPPRQKQPNLRWSGPWLLTNSFSRSKWRVKQSLPLLIKLSQHLWMELKALQARTLESMLRTRIAKASMKMPISSQRHRLPRHHCKVPC